MSKTSATTARKIAQTHPESPDPDLRLLQTEMEALLHILPVAGLHLSPPGQPDEAAVEEGFDNMPV